MSTRKRVSGRLVGPRCLLFLSLVLISLAVLAQNKGGVVTGQIRFPDGFPASGIRVSAMRADTGTGINSGGVLLESLTETDLSGQYRLSGIAPGEYYIIAGTLDAPTYYPGTDSAKDAAVLKIADGMTVSSVNFVTREQSSSSVRLISSGVSGQIIVEGGSSLPAFRPRLYVDTGKGNRRRVFGEDGNEIRGSGSFGAFPVSSDGSFRLLLDDGDYDISLVNSFGEHLNAVEGYYVKSIVSGPVDLSRQKLSVRGRSAPSITITLAATDPPAGR